MKSNIEDQRILRHTIRTDKFERPFDCFRCMHTAKTTNFRNVDHTMHVKIIGHLAGILLHKFRYQRVKIYGFNANRFGITAKQRN